MAFAISGHLQQPKLKLELYGLSVFRCLWPWKASVLKDGVMAVARQVKAELLRLTELPPRIWNMSFCSHHLFLMRTAPGQSWCMAVTS